MFSGSSGSMGRPKSLSVGIRRVRSPSATSAYRRDRVVERHRAMGREGSAVRSCGREAFRQSRFAVWAARRANGAGMVSCLTRGGRGRPQWGRGVEMCGVACEGSEFVDIDDDSSLARLLLAGGRR